MIQIIVPLPDGKLPVTLNTQGNMHRHQLHRIKRETEILISNICAEAGVPFIPSIKEILFTLVVGDRRMRDADNLAPFAKATLDGMKKTGVIDEDHYHIVQRVSYNIHYDKTVKRNYMQVTIWPEATVDDMGNPLPEIVVNEVGSTQPEPSNTAPDVVVPNGATKPKPKKRGKGATNKTPAKAKAGDGSTPPARAQGAESHARRGRVIAV